MTDVFARVGPNAIIQLGKTLEARGLHRMGEQIYARAGMSRLFASPPENMVDERQVKSLFDAVVFELGQSEAHDILSEAGQRTGLYILHNRIPYIARRMLPFLPRRLALRILLGAMSRNAWTFVGSGAFDFDFGGSPRITILNNPICLPTGCSWHVAVFGTLFSALVRPAPAVIETRCLGRGEACCRFDIQ